MNAADADVMEIWQAIRFDRECGAKRLVSEYGNRLYAAAVLLCQNDADAEELVFRTFDQAIKRIGTFAPTGDFFNWLYTILLNFRRMDLRKRRPEVLSVGSSLDLPEVVIEEVGEMELSKAFADAEVEAVQQAVRGLSEPLREVVVLRYFEERSIEDISMLLEIPSGTVKSRLHNAKRMLFVILTRTKGRGA